MVAESFETDRNTQLKALGQKPYDLREVFTSDLPRHIESERAVLLKATDANGEIMGFCAWGFRGLEAQEVPYYEVTLRAKERREKLDREVSLAAQVEEGKVEGVEEGKFQQVEEEAEDDAQIDSIRRLEALTGNNLEEWMEKLMPDGTRCMFVSSLIVAPEYQRQGVGAELLKWGTDVADEKGLFIWVHSSEAGLAAYKKAGFKAIGMLDVDLDEFAHCPPPPKVGGEKWGHYVFTYMKYEAKSIT